MTEKRQGFTFAQGCFNSKKLVSTLMNGKEGFKSQCELVETFGGCTEKPGQWDMLSTVPWSWAYLFLYLYFSPSTSETRQYFPVVTHWI